MSKKALQINFTFNAPLSQLGEVFGPAAKAIADVPGLRWKVWMVNESEKRAGGFYVFDNDAAVDAYLGGPIVAQLASHPAFSNIETHRFDVLDELSAVTRAPLR
jgi:hypothetical protein